MAAPASPHAVRRWGAGTAAIVRLLIGSDMPMTGMAIAEAVGVTQPRASQVLARLASHGAVRASATGYIGCAANLLDLYAHRARPTVDQESYWYSTRPLREQAARLQTVASEADIAVGFSADLGPDLLVPWRHPTVAVVYATAPLELGSAGFVRAEGRADASVITRSTPDRTLLVPARGWPPVVDGISLIDPTQQWWDLLDLGGQDRREAADRMRTAITSREMPGRR